MSTLESYDGLCGLIAPFSSSIQLRCSHPMAHYGECSWKKYHSHFIIHGGCFHSQEWLQERGFIDSVLNSLKDK